LLAVLLTDFQLNQLKNTLERSAVFKFFTFSLELKHPGPGQASRQWVCEVCQAAFHTKSNLTRHRAAAHSLGARLLQCETCGKEFKAAFSDPSLFDRPDQDSHILIRIRIVT
jgi:hypothetical protein